MASLDDSQTSLTVTLTREEGGSGGGLESRFRYLVLLTTLVADYRGRPVEQFVLLQAIDRYEDPRLSPNRTVSFVAHLTAALPDASYQIRLCEVQLATGAGLPTDVAAKLLDSSTDVELGYRITRVSKPIPVV